MAPNTITLLLRGNVWLARWNGEEEAGIRELFGTNEIPTPYTASADPRLVLRAIAGRNPRYVVKLADTLSCLAVTASGNECDLPVAYRISTPDGHVTGSCETHRTFVLLHVAEYEDTFTVEALS